MIASGPKRSQPPLSRRAGGTVRAPTRRLPPESRTSQPGGIEPAAATVARREALRAGAILVLGIGTRRLGMVPAATRGSRPLRFDTRRRRGHIQETVDRNV